MVHLSSAAGEGFFAGTAVDAEEVVAAAGVLAAGTMGVLVFLSAEWTAEMGRSLVGRREKVGWWEDNDDDEDLEGRMDLVGRIALLERAIFFSSMQPWIWWREREKRRGNGEWGMGEGFGLGRERERES